MNILTETEKRLPQIMQRIESSEEGDEMLKVLTMIQRKEPIAYSDLLRRMGWKLSAVKLQAMLAQLIMQEEIEEEHVKGKKGMIRMFSIVKEEKK